LAKESLQSKLGVALGESKHVFRSDKITLCFVALFWLVVIVVIDDNDGTGLDKCRLGRCLRLAGALLLNLAFGGSGRNSSCR
jgi:hypothetical protein